MTTRLFVGPTSKINRAKRHISDLNAELDAFRERKPYRLVVERNPERPQYLIVARVREELPEDFPLIIGDAVHNLRASLDLLACDLVTLNSGSTKHVYFPFSNSAERFEAAIKDRNIDRARPDVVDVIRALKPYTGGNHLLRSLHDLDIADKHTRLIPTTMISGLPGVTTDSGVSFLNCSFGPVVDGTIGMAIPPTDDLQIGQEFKPAFDISFGYGQPFQFQPIVPTLRQLVDLVDGIVSTFVNHFQS